MWLCNSNFEKYTISIEWICSPNSMMNELFNFYSSLIGGEMKLLYRIYLLNSGTSSYIYSSLMHLMKLQFIYSIFFFYCSICVLLFSLNEMWYSENRLWIKNFFILLISYLVGAVGLQSLWSLSLALTDVYALMVRRRFRNTGVVSLFAVGDGVRNLLIG